VVIEALELREETVESVLAAVRTTAVPVRARFANPRADLARQIWLDIDREIEQDRDARWEAIARMRVKAAPAPTIVDPRITEVVERASSIHADSRLRLQTVEALAGIHAMHSAIDEPPVAVPPSEGATPPFIAVAHDGTERGERTFMEVALGDLHIPVRYVRFAEECRGAAVIIDGDWRESLRARSLVAYGRPVIVASTSGAHEWPTASAVYDPLVPESLAEAVRAALRLG
jgi:hypothetical protein